MDSKVLTAALLAILALITVVIVVGLARDNLNPDGVVAVLATLFSGLVVGGTVKGKSSKKEDEEND